MKTVGIVAEYNPFHNGHKLQIERLRERGGIGATHVVAVMSGNFVQRGEPALLPKHERAEMALRGGVDLVIELPVPWAMASAEHFGFGAVALLHALGCVDVLGFGSECGDVAPLSALCDLIEQDKFSSLLTYYLKGGVSFPEAREAALREMHGQADLLREPNNTLGLEYIKALRRLQSPIAPCTVKRIGAAHGDMAPRGNVASGSFIRRQIGEGRYLGAMPYLPEESLTVLDRALHDGRAPASVETVDRAVLAILRRLRAEDWAALPGVSEGLENRLHAAARQATSCGDLLERVKTRRYPLTRLQRILWAAVLSIPADLENEMPPYIRVLASNKRGDEILAAAKPTLPIVSRAPQIERLGGTAATVWQIENRAADFYGLTLPTPLPCGTEYTDRFIREDSKEWLSL